MNKFTPNQISTYNKALTYKDWLYLNGLPKGYNYLPVRLIFTAGETSPIQSEYEGSSGFVSVTFLGNVYFDFDTVLTTRNTTYVRSSGSSKTEFQLSYPKYILIEDTGTIEIVTGYVGYANNTVLNNTSDVAITGSGSAVQYTYSKGILSNTSNKGGGSTRNYTSLYLETTNWNIDHWIDISIDIYSI